MKEVVMKFLNSKGYDNISTSYYDYIDTWEKWWRNDVEFHKYKDTTGKERKMYTLGMAKRVSEDWASILFTERDEIMANAKSNNITNKNNKYLAEQIKLLKVYKDLPVAIEKAMAMGTAAAIIRIKNVVVDNNGSISANSRTKLDIIYVGANQIIPLKVEHGEIIDVAFVSEENKGDKKEYYIEMHNLVYDNERNIEKYVITNTYINDEGNEIYKEGIAKEYTINTNTPLFSILKPAIANPIDTDFNIINGLGFSVYGTAIDQLEVCDITYHNFAMDFYLGGKKVFYNKKIMKKKTIIVQGREMQVEVYPDDLTRQQWATYGDEQTNLHKDPAITEYNPDLRVTEDKEGIQFALNMLSFKAGLGTKYYEFNGSSVVTATQYVGDRQDLISNANKHRKNVDSFVSGIGKSLLLLGRILFNKDVTENCIVTICDKDGFMIDTETAKQEFRQDIAQGIRQAWEYRVKFLGEDEKTAKKMVDEGYSINQIENEYDKDDENEN